MALTMPREFDYWQKLKLHAELEKGAKVSERHARTELLEKWISKRIIVLTMMKNPVDMLEYMGVSYGRGNGQHWCEKADDFPSEALIANIHLAIEFDKKKCIKCNSPIHDEMMYQFSGETICFDCIKNNKELLELYRQSTIYGPRGATGMTGPRGVAGPPVVRPHDIWRTKI